MIVDSLCVTSWRARPVSFVSLMTLYESNYIRMRALLGDARVLPSESVSRTPGDLDLHVHAIEYCRYTTILRMTYLFGESEGPVAEPDLEVRVYHDARLAEACGSATRLRHPGLSGLRDTLPPGLGERWLRNMLLNKWLDYCAERGHRLAPAVAPGAA
jgi:uncharacterized protein YqiB (DUF1249 family)